MRPRFRDIGVSDSCHANPRSFADGTALKEKQFLFIGWEKNRCR
jgi:hypothetical protein